MFAVFGGGNSSRVEYAPALFQFDRLNENVAYRPEYDMDLAPAPVVLVAPQIEATPTAPLPTAAIAPMVTAGEATNPLTAGCPAVIVKTFGEQAPAACAVAWCESRYSAWAIGDHGASVGLFQIQPRWHQWRVPGEDLADPAVNTRAAWLISSGGTDWSAWTCKP